MEKKQLLTARFFQDGFYSADLQGLFCGKISELAKEFKDRLATEKRKLSKTSANFAENPDYEFFRARPFNRIDHRDRAGNVRKPLSYPSPGYSGYSRSERPARTRTHGLGKDRSLYPADSPAVAWTRSSPGTLPPGVGDRADPRACCTGRG